MTATSAHPIQTMQSDPIASHTPSSMLDAWFQQGLALHRQGQIDEAKALYEQILATEPQHADALHLLGVIAAQSNNPALSETLIVQAIAINPNKAAFYTNLGLALKALHRLDEANDNFDKAIARQPDSAEAQNNKGLVLRELQQTTEAIVCFDKAIGFKPDYAEAFYNRGNAFRDLQRTGEALTSYDQAIRLKPGYLEAIFNRGIALQELQRIEEAIACYNQVIAQRPDFAEAFYSRGVALLALKRPEEAIASNDQAIAIKPGYAEAFSNRGLALQELKRTPEALASFEQAIAILPDYADAYVNRGWSLMELKCLDEAITSFDQAIAIQPDHAHAHFNKALALLLTGQYEQGWAVYEWRWKTRSLIPYRRNFPFPLWQGQDSLAGKSILLHAEQGFGDSIQFARYARLVKQLGAHVTLEVPQALLPLFEGLMGVDAFSIKRHPDIPGFDYHCPLMSLPLAFKTDLGNIPSPTPYLFSDPKKAQVWSRRLGPKKGLRVGLVWSGSAEHTNDRNRSLALEQLVAQLPTGNHYVSLQKDVRPEDRKALEFNNIQHHGEDLKDFADTAALCQLMDIVISVDTSVAHLAAALGKPTWLLLSYVPDWRWLFDRDDSPWYASVKLYRQAADRRWEPVLQRLNKDLTAWPMQAP